MRIIHLNHYLEDFWKKNREHSTCNCYHCHISWQRFVVDYILYTIIYLHLTDPPTQLVKERDIRFGDLVGILKWLGSMTPLVYLN